MYLSNYIWKILFLGVFVLSFNGDKVYQKNIDENNKVAIAIEPEYENYFLGQKIWFKIILLNNSDRDYFLKDNFDAYGIKFNVTDPKGKKLMNHRVFHYVILDSMKLMPNVTFENIFPLDNYINDLNSIEGDYIIQATYQNIVSNIVSIKMSSPTGEIEDQYLIFKNLFSLANEKAYLEPNYNIEKSLEFLQKYNNSVYFPDLYDKVLISMLMSGSTNQVESTVKSFFKSNSDTYTSKFIVDKYFRFLVKNGNSTNYAIHKLNEIMLSYKDTKSEYVIENFIKTIQH